MSRVNEYYIGTYLAWDHVYIKVLDESKTHLFVKFMRPVMKSLKLCQACHNHRWKEQCHGKFACLPKSNFNKQHRHLPKLLGMVAFGE